MDQPTKIYDCVMAFLREKRIPQRRIATESGVPFSTVCKIAQGSVTDPSVHTVQKLYDYFSGLDSGVGVKPLPVTAECAPADPRRGVERRRPDRRTVDTRRDEAA